MFNPKMMKTMKKILIAAAFLAMTVSSGAQSVYDAITFSQNQYYGTARSMALGNAMTALGGDLGSIGINPAGSAVTPYSQIVITPGVTVSAVTSAYSPEGEKSYGLSNRLVHTRMNLPNVGLSMSFETGQRYGLRTFSFGFVVNQTNNYHFMSEGFGSNSRTSKIAEFANAARGFNEDVLADYKSFNNSDLPWDILAAYQGGMFGSYGIEGEYAGVTEAISDDGEYHYVPGALSQTSYLTKRGSKNDLILNMAMNFSDRFYIGFNLGIPTARYRYSESFYEAAINPEDFRIKYDDGYETCFLNGSYGYQYMSEMAGIYAKVGVIFRPVDGLRLGASFQTPTAYTISETWGYSASTNYDDSFYNDSASSPQGEYSYFLRSPYRASFGAAFTFAKKGLISVDYELADYSVMRFRSLRENRLGEDAFAQENWACRYFTGVEHSVRVGAELRVTPEWSLRAGYAFSTSPERWWTSSDGQKVTLDDFYNDYYSYLNRIKNLVTPHYYGDRTRTFSAGIGYSSPGSFFMDAVVRMTRYPAATFAPYYDYDSFDRFGNYGLVEAPRILNNRNLWNVAVTFGWRF